MVYRLSGSGKSTLSSHLHSLLKKNTKYLQLMEINLEKKNYKNKFNIENIKK